MRNSHVSGISTGQGSFQQAQTPARSLALFLSVRAAWQLHPPRPRIASQRATIYHDADGGDDAVHGVDDEWEDDEANAGGRAVDACAPGHGRAQNHRADHLKWMGLVVFGHGVIMVFFFFTAAKVYQPPLSTPDCMCEEVCVCVRPQNPKHARLSPAPAMGTQSPQSPLLPLLLPTSAAMDSKRSAPRALQSPTLSPTRSAMTAGLRGSSSGIDFSTWQRAQK